jgi:hypothetical protein
MSANNLTLKRYEGNTVASEPKSGHVSSERLKNWSWNEWIYGKHVKETSVKRRRRLGDYFSKSAPAYSGVPTENRCDVWKILLGITEEISAKEYMRLIKLGRCHVYEKIKCDTFRTLATDKKFKSVVSEGQITRVLNAFAQKAKEGKQFTRWQTSVPMFNS